MIKYVKIDMRMSDEWKHLTRNQIIRMLGAFSNDELLKEYIRINYYHKHKDRLNKDANYLAERYSQYVLDMTNYDKIKCIDYMKIKYDTLQIVIQSKLTKRELLIFLYILKLYKVDLKRDYVLTIKKLLNELFEDYKTNSPMYKNLLIDTLTIMKEWKYDDNSKFIIDFEIRNKDIIIKLDKSKKTRY
jgi:hypothetical protein